MGFHSRRRAFPSWPVCVWSLTSGILSTHQGWVPTLVCEHSVPVRSFFSAPSVGAWHREQVSGRLIICWKGFSLLWSVAGFPCALVARIRPDLAWGQLPTFRSHRQDGSSHLARPCDGVLMGGPPCLCRGVSPLFHCPDTLPGTGPSAFVFTSLRQTPGIRPRPGSLKAATPFLFVP